MRENEFEKQVQQKMDDYNLSPSAEVWIEVERRIRKEKKRRFIFWWFIFFGLLAGGGAAGLWLMNSNKKKKSGIATNHSKTTAEHTQSATDKTITAGNHSQEDDSTAIKRNNKTVVIGEVNKTIATAKESKPVYIGSKQPVVKKEATIKKQSVVKLIVPKKDKPVAKEFTNKEDDGIPVTSVEVVSEPVTPNETVAIVNKVEPSQKEILKQSPPVEKSPEEKKQDTVTALQNEKKEEKKKRKWDSGVAFSAGSSSLVRGLRFSGGPLYADAVALSASGSGNPVQVSSSVIYSSFSWSAGFYVKKPVSKKLDVAIGLSYSYLSAKMNVGSRVDSARVINNSYSSGVSVTNFYRPLYTGNSRVYHNQYHFISLSGDLSWRIIKGKKIKINWDNGISYNHLIGSSMLHYDPNLPGYYRDNKRLLKSQLFISTGFTIPVSRQLLINPFLSYSVTPVLKNESSVKANFRNFGIRIRYVLNNK